MLMLFPYYSFLNTTNINSNIILKYNQSSYYHIICILLFKIPYYDFLWVLTSILLILVILPVSYLLSNTIAYCFAKNYLRVLYSTCMDSCKNYMPFPIKFLFLNFSNLLTTYLLQSSIELYVYISTYTTQHLLTMHLLLLSF